MKFCEKYAIISTKIQYLEATCIERFELKLHLYVCNKCSVLMHKNLQLTKLLDSTKIHVLTENEKQSIKLKLDKVLLNSKQ